ncbi:MAG: hypothetical protein ACM30D_14090 [Hyphomicrobiales bacterium]
MIQYLETMIVLAAALVFAWLKLSEHRREWERSRPDFPNDSEAKGFGKTRMQIAWAKDVPIYWWLYVLLILFAAFAISSGWGASPRD